jgi:hypothetical protein
LELELDDGDMEGMECIDIDEEKGTGIVADVGVIGVCIPVPCGPG